MEPSLLCSDDQRRPPPAATESQPEDLDCVSESPTVNMLFAHEPETETESDLSDTTEQNTDSDRLKSLMSLCSELSPKDDDFRLDCCLDSSEPTLPLLPQLSRDLNPPTSKTFDFYVQQELSPSFPESFVAVSSPPEGLMDPSFTDLISSSSSSPEHSESMSLFRPLTPQSESLDDDKIAAPMPELYIFESDTQDFILSPTLEPHQMKCPEYLPLHQAGGEEVKHECDPHVLMCDSGDIVTRCHHSSGEEFAAESHESDVRQLVGLTPPASDAWEADLMSVSDVRQRREEEEVAGLTLELQRSDSPVELWLDACQYLAGEDAEGQDVLDEASPSVMQGGSSAPTDLSFPPGGSDYSPDGSEGIGWSGDDTRGWGPPVQRWSSVDSWASALSDWTGIIAAPPEDITAAFAEIGAEIDALTQALAEVNVEAETLKEEQSLESESPSTMGVQDQPLKAQNIPDSSIHSHCLSLCFEAAGAELCDSESSQSGESFCDSAPPTPAERARGGFLSCQADGSLCMPPQHSSMASHGATAASPPGYGVDLPTPSADLDFSQFGGYVRSSETDVFTSNEAEPIIPKVVQPIQAVSVSGDPQSLCLWCQFSAVFSDYTVTWSREGTVLAFSEVQGTRAECR